MLPLPKLVVSFCPPCRTFLLCPAPEFAFLARELLLLALVLFHLEPLCPRICIGPLCVLPGLLLRSALCILRPLLLPLHLISLLHYRNVL